MSGTLNFTFGAKPIHHYAVRHNITDCRKAIYITIYKLTVNDEVVQGEAAILDRIHSFDKENLSDTIFLNTGMGYSDDLEPDYSDYEVLFERRGWAHIRDFFVDIPYLEPGRIYCLWVRSNYEAYSDDLSLAMFLMGAVLRRQNWQGITVNCSCSAAADCENRFKLLCKKQ